jgi:hypothetical protein
MASASDVFPAPALEIKTTFLSDSLPGSLMGPSFSSVCLVSLVYLVYSVCPVYLVEEVYSVFLVN